jgi:hypothetical protein
MAPTSDKGHMNIRGSAAPDKQRLHAPRGDICSTTSSALGVDVESDDLRRDRHLCRESESGWSDPS